MSGGNLASPLLAEAVGGGPGTTGGAVLLAVISAVASATILAVVAGLTLTSTSSVAHDLYASVFKKGVTTDKDEVKVARIAFLVALAFAVAASANLPALLDNLFWKRFNTRGAVWSIYGGLISAVGLVFFSPIVSGKFDPESGANLSLFPAGVDFAWFPLENPGLASISLGFFFGWLGTVTPPRRVAHSGPPSGAKWLVERAKRNHFAPLAGVGARWGCGGAVVDRGGVRHNAKRPRSSGDESDE